MAYETIIYEKKGRVAIVTLNQPDSLNALSLKMSAELDDVYQRIEDDDEVNVMVITGTGRAFSSGPNMREVAQGRRTGGPRIEGTGGYHNPARMTKPVVGAINGMCVGGALILMGNCDVVICSENATFFDAHVDVGWLPLDEFMALHIPYGLAMRLCLMGLSERMSAERAYQIGLVSEVVPEDKLMERAIEIAGTIASKAPLVTRYLRQTMRRMYLEEPYAQAKAEANRWVHIQVNRAPDGIEGPRAFAEKRKAVWTGEGGPAPRPKV